MGLQRQVLVNVIAATLAYDTANACKILLLHKLPYLQRQGVQQRTPWQMTGSKQTLNPALVASSVRL